MRLLHLNESNLKIWPPRPPCLNQVPQRFADCVRDVHYLSVFNEKKRRMRLRTRNCLLWARPFFASNFGEVNRPYEVSVRRKTRVELCYPITGELLILTVHKNHQSVTSEKQHIGKTSPCRKRARPKGRGGRTPSPLRMANSIKLDGVRKFATNYSAEKE